MKIALLRSAVFAAALGLGTLGQANAATYTTLDTEKSKVTFSYSQMNVDMTGGFSEIKATELNFDPANAAAAKVKLEIALKGVDAGNPDANSELAKNEWLNTAAHPLATFTSKKVTATGDNKFDVLGDLSIKGNTRELTVPVTLKQDNNSGLFEGQFKFQRADFGIGEGQWKDFSIVANEIVVKFSLVANP